MELCVTVGRISDFNPKKFCASMGIEPWSLAIWVSVMITRSSRHLIVVTFTPPRRKHVLMRLKLRDHTGHQM